MEKIFDKIGICVSGLCLVHCLIMPILLLAFPALNGFLGHSDHELHLIFAVLVVISAILAIYPHCKKSGRKDILSYAIFGMGTILFAISVGHEVSESVEHLLTILGSVSLIIAHLKNIKVKHSKCEDTQTPCSNHH